MNIRIFRQDPGVFIESSRKGTSLQLRVFTRWLILSWQGLMRQPSRHSSCQLPVSAHLTTLSLCVRRQRPTPPGRQTLPHCERAIRARAAAAPRNYPKKGAGSAPAGPRSWQQTSKSQEKKSSSGSSGGKPAVKKGGTIRTGAEQAQDDHQQRLSKVSSPARISESSCNWAFAKRSCLTRSRC